MGEMQTSVECVPAKLPSRPAELRETIVDIIPDEYAPLGTRVTVYLMKDGNRETLGDMRMGRKFKHSFVVVGPGGRDILIPQQHFFYLEKLHSK